MTHFDATLHGFKFVNMFTTEPVQDVRFGGLCGGMAYAALDYFYSGTPIPQQDTRPATGSALFNYIYNRQVTSITENLDKWAELGFNPFGWRTKEFFNWGLQASTAGACRSSASRSTLAGPSHWACSRPATAASDHITRSSPSATT